MNKNDGRVLQVCLVTRKK